MTTFSDPTGRARRSIEDCEKSMVDTRVKDALVQVFLRMLPILPANELYGLIRSVNQSRLDVEKQVEEAVSSLQRSSQLIRELEDSLSSRTDRLKELQAEYQKYAELSKISEEQASALIKQIGGELGRSAKRERLISFLINLVAGSILFVLGVIFSKPITSIFGNFFN